MKNIKVLGLAIVASIVAAPAFAGETYVRNEWTTKNGFTDTNLTLDSDTTSHRFELYDSYADKVYVEGELVTNTDGKYHANGTYEGDESGRIFYDYPTFVHTDNGPRYSREGYQGEESGDISLNGNYQETSTINAGDGYTVHTAGSSLWGAFYEFNTTRLDGSIISREDILESVSHETSAGVR